MKNGYIKLFRSLKEWYGYSSSKKLHLWIDLLLESTHKERSVYFNGEMVELTAGQLVTDRRKLSLNTGISESYVESLLSEFEKHGQIRQQKSNRSRLITIVTWNDYQITDIK